MFSGGSRDLRPSKTRIFALSENSTQSILLAYRLDPILNNFSRG